MLYKTIFFLFILLSVLNCSAQIQLNPVLGLAICRVKQVQKSDFLSTHSLKSEFWGFEVQKTINAKSSIIFPLHISGIVLNATVRDVYVYKYTGANQKLLAELTKKELHLETLGSDLYSIGVIYERNLCYIPIARKPKPDDRIIKNNLNLIISSSFGVTLNTLGLVCWGGDCNEEVSKDTSAASIDYSQFSSSQSDFTYLGNGNMVRNTFSSSLNFGIKFQFKNGKNKDKLFLKLMHSQGLIPLIESPYRRDLTSFFNTKTVAESYYRSFGTYTAFYLSYPITILNKKGERYRDRHPKK